MDVFILKYDDGSGQYSEIIGVYANTDLIEESIYDLDLDRNRIKIESFILIE